MWTCDSCGELNADGADVCDVCDRPRANATEEAPARRVAPDQRAVAVHHVPSPPPPQPEAEPEPLSPEPHTAWPDDDTGHPRSTDRRQVWIVAFAAVALTALALTAMVVLPRVLRSGEGTAAAAPTPPPATASPWPSDTPDSTDTPTPTDSSQDTTPAPSESAGGTTGLVRIDPGVGDSRAADIAAMFETYFGGINDKDYAAVATVLDPAGSIDPDDADQMAAFQKGTRSTRDSDITLVAISGLTGDLILAEVTFQSEQNAGDGPRGRSYETCTRWDIAYTISSSTAGYRIVKGKAASRPC